MDLRFLNTICFVICVFCIVIGLALGVYVIWISTIDQLVWKVLLTDGLVFGGALLTMFVSNAFQMRVSIKIDDRRTRS